MDFGSILTFLRFLWFGHFARLSIWQSVASLIKQEQSFIKMLEFYKMSILIAVAAFYKWANPTICFFIFVFP